MKNKHILMIDDDPAIQRLFGAKFASAGFDVMYAHDGHSGREMARRFMPDIILLDLRMPETDGYTIARLLKTEPKTKDIPVVFLTNEDFTPEAEKAAKEVWVSDYLHKSMDLNEVVKRVKSVIKESNHKK
jgi:DNA-binding response OmpR family regulator